MRMTQDMDDDEKGKLFVGGLSWETTQENLQRYFARYGDVIDCVVMKNNESGRSRGFGFVTFADPANVNHVLQSGPHNLDGRTIDPKPCNPRTLQKQKTCNLETYLDWSARLQLLASNEILQCNGITERSRIVEMWSGAAQYCLLVGNYNSATAILETLDSPPVARLTGTWSKLSSTCQQLNCMQRHAEGCGDLWHKQTEASMENAVSGDKIKPQKQKSSTHISTKVKSSDWVVIPVFADIVRLALMAREDCLLKFANGHINIAAFNRLAAIVGAFTRHMNQVIATPPETGEFNTFWQKMHQCSLHTETDLLLASFDCEPPTASEKLNYNIV